MFWPPCGATIFSPFSLDYTQCIRHSMLEKAAPGAFRSGEEHLRETSLKYLKIRGGNKQIIQIQIVLDSSHRKTISIWQQTSLAHIGTINIISTDFGSSFSWPASYKGPQEKNTNSDIVQGFRVDLMLHLWWPSASKMDTVTKEFMACGWSPQANTEPLTTFKKASKFRQTKRLNQTYLYHTITYYNYNLSTWNMKQHLQTSVLPIDS